MACMGQQDKGKFGKWLKKKLQAISHKPDKLGQALAQDKQAPQQQQRPLRDGLADEGQAHAARRRKAAPALVNVSQQSIGDDCSPRASSDQLSFGAEPTTAAAR